MKKYYFYASGSNAPTKTIRAKNKEKAIEIACKQENGELYTVMLQHIASIKNNEAFTD